jgi:predicted ATP-grasp superfamily ATP-dependent carboligase
VRVPVASACVLGDIDLVSALGRAGIRSAVAAHRDDPAAYSRHAAVRLDPLDHWTEPAAYVERLVAWARTQPAPPVLFFQTDGDVLMVSRHRDRLASAFSFVIADAALVEDCVDKARFAERAARLGLPVPPTLVVTGRHDDRLGDVDFPVIVKPLLRQDLRRVVPEGKARRVATRDELRRVLGAAPGVPMLVQELVPGPESRVESYHAYVGVDGEVRAEFTGAKLRTNPPEYGETTALRITDAPDVRAVGRDVVSRLNLRGVVKVDLKRAERRLVLLEVNPRFSLWHLPGAVAGVNVPALVHADLVGTPRQRPRPARAGVTWVHPVEDRHVCRTWLAAAVRSDVRHAMDPKDPMPLLRGMVIPALRRRLARRAASPRGLVRPG